MSGAKIMPLIEAAEVRAFERSLDSVFHALKEELKNTNERVKRLEEIVERLRRKQ
jgi:hypothetical protein